MAERKLSLVQIFDNIAQLCLIRTEHKDLKYVNLALRIIKDFPHESVSELRWLMKTKNGYRETLKRYYPGLFPGRGHKRTTNTGCSECPLIKGLPDTCPFSKGTNRQPPCKRNNRSQFGGNAQNFRNSPLQAVTQHAAGVQKIFDEIDKKTNPFPDVAAEAMDGRAPNILGDSLSKLYRDWIGVGENTISNDPKIAVPSRATIFSFLIASGKWNDEDLTRRLMAAAGLCFTPQYFMDIIFQYFQDNEPSINLNIVIFNYALIMVGVDIKHTLSRKQEKSYTSEDQTLLDYYNKLIDEDKQKRRVRNPKLTPGTADYIKEQKTLADIQAELALLKRERDKILADLENAVEKELPPPTPPQK